MQVRPVLCTRGMQRSWISFTLTAFVSYSRWNDRTRSLIQRSLGRHRCVMSIQCSARLNSTGLVTSPECCIRAFPSASSIETCRLVLTPRAARRNISRTLWRLPWWTLALTTHPGKHCGSEPTDSAWSSCKGSSCLPGSMHQDSQDKVHSTQVLIRQGFISSGCSSAIMSWPDSTLSRHFLVRVGIINHLWTHNTCGSHDAWRWSSSPRKDSPQV